jgi:hypothetical protein
MLEVRFKCATPRHVGCLIYDLTEQIYSRDSKLPRRCRQRSMRTDATIAGCAGWYAVAGTATGLCVQVQTPNKRSSVYSVIKVLLINERRR